MTGLVLDVRIRRQPGDTVAGSYTTDIHFHDTSFTRCKNKKMVRGCCCILQTSIVMTYTR